MAAVFFYLTDLVGTDYFLALEMTFGAIRGAALANNFVAFFTVFALDYEDFFVVEVGCVLAFLPCFARGELLETTYQFSVMSMNSARITGPPLCTPISSKT